MNTIKTIVLTLLTGSIAQGAMTKGFWASGPAPQPKGMQTFITNTTNPAQDLKTIASLSGDALESPNADGRTLLMQCIYWRKPVEVIRALITQGAAVNARHVDQGGVVVTPLTISLSSMAPVDHALVPLLEADANVHEQVYGYCAFIPRIFLYGPRNHLTAGQEENSNKIHMPAGEWMLFSQQMRNRLKEGLQKRSEKNQFRHKQLVTTALSGTGLHVKELIEIIANYQSYLSEADEALLIRAQQKIK